MKGDVISGVVRGVGAEIETEAALKARIAGKETTLSLTRCRAGAARVVFVRTAHQRA